MHLGMYRWAIQVSGMMRRQLKAVRGAVGQCVDSGKDERSCDRNV